MTEKIPEPIRAKIRRWYVPDAVYFITVVTQNRQRIFANNANIHVLRDTMHKAKAYHPFKMRAYAFMADHVHLLIYVPETTNISALMHSIQRNFTVNYKKAHGIEASTHIWQRGFWDHVIRDEVDYANHVDYIHYNPVKHGYGQCPWDYPHTSFREYVKMGWYEPHWGTDVLERLDKFDFE